MRIVYRLLAVLAWSAAALAVVLAGLALAAAFPAGRAAIADLATAVVSATTDIAVEIEGVDRLTPVAVDVQRVRVAMRGERIAAVDGLHLRLRWGDLLRGRLRPSLVHVEQVAIETLPAGGGEEDGASGGIRIALPLLPAEAIRIDRLSLAEAVLGEAAELRIAATEADTAGEHAIDAELQRMDRPGDGVTLRVRYRPEAATLDIRGHAAEAAGGLLARRLGARPDAELRAELAGAGPLEAWRGRLTAAVDGIASIAADIGIDRGVGAVAGEARIEPALLPDLAPLLGNAINYRARLRWSESEGLHIESSRIRLADITLGLTGTVAPDFSTVQLQLSSDLSLATLAPVAGMPLQGTAGILLHVAGPPARPAIAGDLVLSEPRFGAAGSANAVLRLEARVDREGRYRVELGGNVAGVTGVPEPLAPLLAGSIDLDTALDVSAEADEIHLAKLSLRGAALTAEGDAVLRLKAGESQARIGLRAELPPGAGPVTGGRAVLDLTGTAELAAGSFRAESSLVGEGLAFADAALGRLLGAAPRLTAAVVGTAGAPLRIEQARAQFAAGEATATGSFDPASGNLDLEVTAGMPDLALLSELVGRSLAGRAEMAARVTGPSSDPSAQGKIVIAELALATQRIDRGELSFDLRQLIGEPQGHVTAAIRMGGADYRLAVDPRLRNRTDLDLAKLVANAPGLAASGDLTVDIARVLARGRINVNATDLAPTGSIAGMPLAGRGQVALRLDAANGQQVTADIKGDGLRAADIALGRLEGRARVDDALGTPRADISLAGRDVATGAVTLSRWQLAAQGGLARATFDLSLAGEAGGPISARAGGNVGMEGSRWQLGLRSFEARHGEIAVKLDGATELRGDAGAIRLSATEMTVGEARLSLAGGLANGQVDGYLRSGAFPLSLLRAVQPDLPLRGRLDIDVSAAGPAAEPRISAKLRSDNLRLRRSEATVALALDLALGDGRLAGRATIGNLADQPLVATAALPLRLGLVPWRLDWSPEGPIEGRLDGKVDLARVLPPLIPEGDSIAGVADVRVALGGSLARPAATGAVKLSGGRYENAVAEAAINDLALDLAMDGSAVKLAARGTDGDSGTVMVDGTLNLTDRDQPIAGTLALRNFWVARRADASVRMAGDVDLAGTTAAPRLAGKLAILQADLQLPEQLPPDVVKLDVVEINAPGHPPQASGAPAPGSAEGGLKVGLDLTVGADRRVFVRGRGLESEWRGDLRLRGDTTAPDIAGTLEAINGRLDFLGQRFQLTKGRLLFPGGTRIDPDLDVATELTRGEITAIVSVGGTLSAPALSLSARPDMPPEEVVSRMLFQRGTAKLSPLQAVQVAQSVLALTGGGGSAGVVDRLRRATGLDVLDFEGGEGEGAAGSVSVGKYVADNVLLRAEQGLDSTGPRAGIEVEVTRNISVESKVGATGATSLGVKLKKDY